MTPAPSVIGTMRPLALVAVLAATAAFTGCSRASSHGSQPTVPTAIISQRYQAAADPANAALAAMVKRALAYSGGSPADIDSAVPATVTSLKTAARQLRSITGAAEPLHRDIVDVMNAMNTALEDLTALSQARGNDIQPDIARFVADAGREMAADTLVRLAVTQLTSPTTVPTGIVVPSTTIPPPTASTSSPRRTTTTRPRTTTSAVSRTTTTRRATTTTTVKVAKP